MIRSIALISCFLIIVSCGQPEKEPFEQFFENLAAHCEDAYPGGLTLEPEGDEMLTGTELLIVHFRECDEDQLKLPPAPWGHD